MPNAKITATSLRSLMYQLVNLGDDDDSIDWTALPTYGGDEPDNTTEVWSWDADHLLVGTCCSDLSIVRRADWRA